MIDNASPTEVCGLVFNPETNEVLMEGELIALTAIEFRLLHFLASHPGCEFARRLIVDAVQGEDYPATDRAVDVQVAGLRKKLGSLGDRIETVRSVGYRFRKSLCTDVRSDRAVGRSPS